jgi:hypothetical protein
MALSRFGKCHGKRLGSITCRNTKLAVRGGAKQAEQAPGSLSHCPCLIWKPVTTFGRPVKSEDTVVGVRSMLRDGNPIASCAQWLMSNLHPKRQGGHKPEEDATVLGYSYAEQSNVLRSFIAVSAPNSSLLPLSKSIQENVSAILNVLNLEM